MSKQLKLFFTISLFVIFSFFLNFFIISNNKITISIFPTENEMDISAYLSGKTTTNTIHAYFDGYTDYYLFLPSHAEGKRVSFTTSDSIFFNNSQESPSQLLNENCSYRFNDTYILHILIGSNIPTAFINLEHNLTYLTQTPNHEKNRTTSGYVTFLTTDGSTAYSGDITKMRGRGNATWTNLAKKPFNITLNDSVSLYGMTPSTEYCLLSSYDDTFLRNQLSNEIGKCLNLTVMQRKHINLYINGEYQGIYELSEKISSNTLGLVDLESSSTNQIEKSSHLTQVTTDEHLNDQYNTLTGKWWTWDHDDLSSLYGGYILESELGDRFVNEPSGFALDTGSVFVCKEPTYLSEGQYTYVSTFMQHCENMLYQSLSSGEREPLEQCMDVPSFIGKYLLEELSKNLDASVTSQYFYINENSKLVAGPIWDYDHAYGCDVFRDNIDYSSPEGFSARENIFGNFAWWQVIYYTSCLRDEIIQTYNDTLYPFTETLISLSIPTWESTLTESAVMDYLRWNRASSEQSAREMYHAHVQSVASFLDTRKDYLYQSWNP